MGTPMDNKDFEQLGKRGFYRPSARVSFEQGVEMVASAMRHARALGLVDLLVNTKGLVDDDLAHGPRGNALYFPTLKRQ